VVGFEGLARGDVEGQAVEGLELAELAHLRVDAFEPLVQRHVVDPEERQVVLLA
jgi:hypothetical protein